MHRNVSVSCFVLFRSIDFRNFGSAFFTKRFNEDTGFFKHLITVRDALGRLHYVDLFARTISATFSPCSALASDPSLANRQLESTSFATTAAASARRTTQSPRLSRSLANRASTNAADPVCLKLSSRFKHRPFAADEIRSECAVRHRHHRFRRRCGVG